jgi:hypothetical protein
MDLMRVLSLDADASTAITSSHGKKGPENNLNPFKRAPLTHNLITIQRVRISTHELQGDTNIQSIIFHSCPSKIISLSYAQCIHSISTIPKVFMNSTINSSV